MLRKLIKYELKATARVMLPLYLAVVALAGGLRLLTVWQQGLHYEAIVGLDPAGFLLQLFTIGFGLAMLAAPIAAVVLMIVRFKTNLLSDEGYVMFTLPVSIHKLVWSKLLSSVVWLAGAAAADAAGVLLLSLDQNTFSGLLQSVQDMFQDLTAYYAVSGVLLLAELVVLLLVLCLCQCLQFYCPMAIGHSFARHKVLLSVVFFFVISALTQAAGMVLLTAGTPFLDSLDTLLMGLPSAVTLHVSLLAAVLAGIIYGGILYAVTVRMLGRHLNLE